MNSNTSQAAQAQQQLQTEQQCCQTAARGRHARQQMLLKRRALSQQVNECISGNAGMVLQHGALPDDS